MPPPRAASGLRPRSPACSDSSTTSTGRSCQRGYGPRHPQSQRVLAERLGVHPVSVQRNQPRAQARFAELLADPAHQEVSAHATELGQRLGPYVPADILDVELRRLGVDPSGQAAQLLLHVAGPYVDRGQWVENTSRQGATPKWRPSSMQFSYANLHHRRLPAACLDRPGHPPGNRPDLPRKSGGAATFRRCLGALDRRHHRLHRRSRPTRPWRPRNRRGHPRHDRLQSQHEPGHPQRDTVRGLTGSFAPAGAPGACAPGHH